jgi:hypothetical protein
MPAATLLLALQLLAPPPPDAPAELAAAIRLVEAGDLDGAVPALQQALRALEQGRAPARLQARAHLYLAMACLGLGALDTAREHMRAVWRHDPALVLDAREYPPPVIALHGAARPADTPRAPGRHLTALVGLGAAASVTGVALAGRGGEAGPPPAPEPEPDSGPPSLRLSNCDDECHAHVNGVRVATVGLGRDSGPVELAPFLREGRNEIAFELVNLRAGITYTFEVRAGEEVLFRETCGVVHDRGCDDDRRYPPGPARRFVYTLFQRRGR